MVSVKTTQLYHYSIKVAIDKMQMNGQGCVTIKSFLQNGQLCFLPILLETRSDLGLSPAAGMRGRCGLWWKRLGF